MKYAESLLQGFQRNKIALGPPYWPEVAKKIRCVTQLLNTNAPSVDFWRIKCSNLPAALACLVVRLMHHLRGEGRQECRIAAFPLVPATTPLPTADCGSHDGPGYRSPNGRCVGRGKIGGSAVIRRRPIALRKSRTKNAPNAAAHGAAIEALSHKSGVTRLDAPTPGVRRRRWSNSDNGCFPFPYRS